MQEQYRIFTTDVYNRWQNSIKDKNLIYKINVRIERIVNHSYFGDTKYIKNGLYELRFHTKNGIRIYYRKEHNRIILLMSGGNKSTQKRDIKRALKIEYDNFL
jgi:putative addiction module killer protein